jgi:glycogen operon protein
MRRDLLELVSKDFGVGRGRALPLGATAVRDGVNFAVYTSQATEVWLALFRPGDAEPFLELPLDPRFNRTGDVWHVLVKGLDPGVEYAFRADRRPNPAPRIHRFERSQLLLDPCAKAVAGAAVWGEGPRRRPRRGRVVDDGFDWGTDTPINRHLADSVIYEIHVRGFTRHDSSGVAHQGTYRGVVEKIPYLRELGVTAVELLPVTEFEENDGPRGLSEGSAPLRNFWGYQPLAFHAPKAGYAASGPEAGEVREFKEMVKALHAAGIEVILDMVFNHTGEGEAPEPAVSLRGLDNATYYLLDPATGEYRDYSGCGNTLNCNHPVVRSLILDCLRYWVTEMHVDGFRFDLASILGRGPDGSVLANPPLLEIIAADPVLAHTKLIAEAWDAAGLYQVGRFPHWGRWAEWNGHYRDDVRSFLRGDPDTVRRLATRLAGSADLYQGEGRAPFHSVNFLTSHDGFTLADLYSYERKHNEMNGERNRDGHDDNRAWNCGVEGATDDPEVLQLRRRQVRNALATLVVSHGVPMLLGGDEIGRTQRGNNNAWCQDNEISWLDWAGVERHADLLRFAKLLLRFRADHSALRRRSFAAEGARARIEWLGPAGATDMWAPEARALGFHVVGRDGDEVLSLFNSGKAPVRFVLPKPRDGGAWRRVLDSFEEPPDDIDPPGAERTVPTRLGYTLRPHSVAVLVGGRGRSQ